MNFLDAVIKNNVEQVNLSLEQGVNPNIYEDKAHITALHFAAQNNALEVAEILIAAGADPKEQTEERQTALDFAKLHGHKQMVNLLNNAITTSNASN